MLVQPERTILGKDTNRIYAGIYTVTKREIDDLVLSAESNRRFCKFFSKIND